MTSEQNTPAPGKGATALGKDSAPRGAPASKLSGKVLKRAYDNAQRVVDRDAEILDQLRSRASILLAALAIGGAILGAVLASAAHPQLPWWVVAPLVAAIVLCVFVLWSTRDHGRLTTPVRKKRRTAKQRAASVAGNLDAAIAGAEVRTRRASQAIGRAREAAKALDNKDLAKIREQVRVAAAELERVRALAQARSETDAARLASTHAFLSSLVTDHIGGAQQTIGQVRDAAEALIAAASRVHDHAVTAADALEHGRWRRSGRRARRGWQLFWRPWAEWFRALAEGNQRLWKTRLTRYDISEARRYAARRARQPQRKLTGSASWLSAEPEWKVADSAARPRGEREQELVDRFLLQRLYDAHSRNDGTINRRADLLRWAAVFTALFVLALGIWLSSMTSSAPAPKHESSISAQHVHTSPRLG